MMKRQKTNSTRITAAGGAVYRGNADNREILLIYRNGYWDLPKGKWEEGESIKKCAVREVAEETGLSHIVIEKPLITTEHSYTQSEKTLLKTTHWFKMKTHQKGKLRPQTEEGIEQVCWIPVIQAHDKLGYDNLKKVITAFLKSF